MTPISDAERDKVRLLWDDRGAPHYGRFKGWFEPAQSACTHPPKAISLLTCRHCFRKFGSEYSVIRGVVKEADLNGVADKSPLRIQDYLIKKIDRLRDPEELDRVVDELNAAKPRLTRYKAYSLVSKVAAFLHPDRINPYDSFAKRGLADMGLKNHRTQTNEGPLANFQSCCDLILSENEAVFSSLVEEINGRPAEHGPFPKDILRRRLLDYYLMARGGAFDRRISYLSGEDVTRKPKVVDQCGCPADSCS